MPKPFDATLKHLLEQYPRDWLGILNLPVSGPVEVIDADLSTITAESDKLFCLQEPEPWILHLELVASYKPDVPGRTLRYNVLVEYRHALPTESAVVLLRPAADGAALTGTLRQSTPIGEKLQFRYQVVRIWELPVENVLAGGLGTLPLALLTDDSSDRLDDVVRRMDHRITQEASSTEANFLWTASYILMGLRYPPEQAGSLLQGVRNMRESSTYQAILEEGRQEGRQEGREEGRQEGREIGHVEAMREVIVRLGVHHLGELNNEIRAKLEAIEDTSRLNQIVDRIQSVDGWEELIDGNGSA